MAVEGIVAKQIDFTELEVQKVIGKGVSGDVYKCYWRTEDKYVALKRIRKQFDKEVEAMCRIAKHPNIIDFYATTSQKEFIPRNFIIIEYAANGSLFGYFQQRPKLPELMRSMRWAKEIANGMAFIHKLGEAHRDLKSTNVLLTSTWTAKICDFGNTKELNRTAAATAHTGTYGWMAPEVLREQSYSNKCDVYSFGILLWELVTHDVPYSGLSETQILMEVGKENGLRPEIPDSCPLDLKKLIVDCWQEDRTKRPEFPEILKRLPLARRITFTELAVEKAIAKGATGEVYKCYWKTEEKHVALKQISEERGSEVEAMARLPKHENIIDFYATTSQQQFIPRYYIIMEFAENGSLFEYFQQRPKQPDFEKSMKWAKDIANGMAFIHNHGEAHRDLKSTNVLLTSDWTAKICDFGSTKELNRTAAATALTGTYGWMAPEVLREQSYSNKCDVYSFGILLWELVTHDVPYSGLSETQILMEVGKENGLRPEIPDSCPLDLKKLIVDCWQEDRTERPEFTEILEMLSQRT